MALFDHTGLSCKYNVQTMAYVRIQNIIFMYRNTDTMQGVHVCTNNIITLTLYGSKMSLIVIIQTSNTTAAASLKNTIS